MLDDAFPPLKRKIEAGKIQIALLNLFHNPQRVQVVIERSAVRAHERVQLSLSSVAKWGMPDVVYQCQRLGKLGVDSQRGSHRAGNLRHFERVRQTIPKMVGETRGKYLCFGFQAAKCA